MKPTCVPCQRFYRPKHNGHYFTEGMPKDSLALPGKAEPDQWVPYKVWVGDLWECPTCGHQTIAGVNSQHVSEHYRPDFYRWHALSQIQINDC